MDNIIIFSNSIEQHYKDLNKIINILFRANMKISLEKSKYFKRETSFLRYIVFNNVINTDPEKMCHYGVIIKYPLPKNIRKLRSFLDLTGYYKKFVLNLEVIMAKFQKECQKNVNSAR